MTFCINVAVPLRPHQKNATYFTVTAFKWTNLENMKDIAFIHSFKGINNSLWSAAEPVCEKHKKANMECSWSVGKNMTCCLLGRKRRGGRNGKIKEWKEMRITFNSSEQLLGSSVFRLTNTKQALLSANGVGKKMKKVVSELCILTSQIPQRWRDVLLSCQGKIKGRTYSQWEALFVEIRFVSNMVQTSAQQVKRWA